MTPTRADGDDSDLPGTEVPPHGYTGTRANQIETKWQESWAQDGVFNTPNPSGDLADGFAHAQARRKIYVLDMSPYPSGSGLHGGHPLGYVSTDAYARYQRMKGANVLHPFGYDAFGLPAERHAIDRGEHPRVTTEINIANMRRQVNRLGLGHDRRREIVTSDPRYYRWTQWIFLQIFNSWFDPAERRARPITELVRDLDAGVRTLDNANWSTLDANAKRRAVDSYRLAYLDNAPVHWCPILGTVLANEEVTADGRSAIGNYPVHTRSMRQWKMRIRAYADRLLDGLEAIDWPSGIKTMQRNWIGRSEGVCIDFQLDIAGEDRDVYPSTLSVFTTRPETLFGVTFLVAAPEHPLAAAVAASWPGPRSRAWGVPASWRGTPEIGAPTYGWTSAEEAAIGYRSHAAQKSDIERQMGTRLKTGVFSGVHAINPATGERIPVFFADYALMANPTGAILAVPAHDQRDFDLARALKLPVVAVVRPPQQWLSERLVTEDTRPADWPAPYTGDGMATRSTNADVALDGLSTVDARRVVTVWLERAGLGKRETAYKLNDWLFSRQRYWGEPIPIVFDEHDLPIALPESHLPVELPNLEDFAPRLQLDPSPRSRTEYPLARAAEWAEVTLDLGDGPKVYRRDLNTMPQWAGSCWYYLRYLDPTNTDVFVSSDIERYWMGAPGERRAGGSPMGVDLYVGGAEHAIDHLLYARFWHNVLYDLGHVSTSEPFGRLMNQGYILAPAYTDSQGEYVPADEVESQAGTYRWRGGTVKQEYKKMGTSLKNSVAPDNLCDLYGADTLRLFEMSTGPLEADRPWSTTALAGVHGFLQRLWRNLVDETTGVSLVTAEPLTTDSRAFLHRTIDAVDGDLARLRFDTAIARLIALSEHLTAVVAAGGGCPREAADSLVLMLAPLAPHVAEELWRRSGHSKTLAYEPFPEADRNLLLE